MEQTDLVLVRVEKDRGDSVPDDFTVPKILAHLSDWKLWVFGTYTHTVLTIANANRDDESSLGMNAPHFSMIGLMFFCASVPAYAVK